LGPGIREIKKERKKTLRLPESVTQDLIIQQNNAEVSETLIGKAILINVFCSLLARTPSKD
jgi:hypothetical protein